MRQADVRATRFGAALTATLAATGAALANPWLAAALAALLLAGAAWGGRGNLWGVAYRAWVAPRLPRPTPAQLEPEAAPRFANLLGGLMAAGAAATLLAGLAAVGILLLGVVAALALLNAAVGVCLGCRLYGLLVLRRARPLAPEAGE